MRIHNTAASVLSIVLSLALCLPLDTWAQNTSQPGSQPQRAPSNDIQISPDSPQPNAPATQAQVPSQKPPAGGATVNPSQPPLQPVTTYPDASGNEQQARPDMETQVGIPESPQPKTQQTEQPQNEPQGAATAERVPTAGGAAAKPAGVAIAPAKQHQGRSLLIKLGAVAAGAVAAGTIYALSRGTPSTPPGANSPGAVQKRSR